MRLWLSLVILGLSLLGENRVQADPCRRTIAEAIRGLEEQNPIFQFLLSHGLTPSPDQFHWLTPDGKIEVSLFSERLLRQDEKLNTLLALGHLGSVEVRADGRYHVKIYNYPHHMMRVLKERSGQHPVQNEASFLENIFGGPLRTLREEFFHIEQMEKTEYGKILRAGQRRLSELLDQLQERKISVLKYDQEHDQVWLNPEYRAAHFLAEFEAHALAESEFNVLWERAKLNAKQNDGNALSEVLTEAQLRFLAGQRFSSVKAYDLISQRPDALAAAVQLFMRSSLLR